MKCLSILDIVILLFIVALAIDPSIYDVLGSLRVSGGGGGRQQMVDLHQWLQRIRIV